MGLLVATGLGQRHAAFSKAGNTPKSDFSTCGTAWAEGSASPAGTMGRDLLPASPSPAPNLQRETRYPQADPPRWGLPAFASIPSQPR